MQLVWFETCETSVNLLPLEDGFTLAERTNVSSRMATDESLLPWALKFVWRYAHMLEKHLLVVQVILTYTLLFLKCSMPSESLAQVPETWVKEQNWYFIPASEIKRKAMKGNRLDKIKPKSKMSTGKHRIRSKMGNRLLKFPKHTLRHEEGGGGGGNN
jgi:hypothetical protein